MAGESTKKPIRIVIEIEPVDFQDASEILITMMLHCDAIRDTKGVDVRLDAGPLERKYDPKAN